MAETRGPDAGFDILSFDPAGRQRHIEVKSTPGSESSAFFITKNELAFGAAHPESYEIHRVFLIDLDPQVVVYPGDPERPSSWMRWSTALGRVSDSHRSDLQVA